MESFWHSFVAHIISISFRREKDQSISSSVAAGLEQHYYKENELSWDLGLCVYYAYEERINVRWMWVVSVACTLHYVYTIHHVDTIIYNAMLCFAFLCSARLCPTLSCSATRKGKFNALLKFYYVHFLLNSRVKFLSAKCIWLDDYCVCVCECGSRVQIQRSKH